MSLSWTVIGIFHVIEVVQEWPHPRARPRIQTPSRVLGHSLANTAGKQCATNAPVTSECSMADPMRTKRSRSGPTRRPRIQTQSRILGHWLTPPLKTRKVQRLNPVPKCSGPVLSKQRLIQAQTQKHLEGAGKHRPLQGQGRCDSKRGWCRKESQSRVAAEKVPGALSVMPSLSDRMWPAYSCIVWHLHVKAVDALHVTHWSQNDSR